MDDAPSSSVPPLDDALLLLPAVSGRPGSVAALFFNLGNLNLNPDPDVGVGPPPPSGDTKLVWLAMGDFPPILLCHLDVVAPGVVAVGGGRDGTSEAWDRCAKTAVEAVPYGEAGE